MTDKPRVVHVITRLLRGGTEENTMLCCQAQVADGYDVWLAHGSSSSEDIWSVRAPEVTFESIPSLVHPISLGADVRALAELVRMFRTVKPDIVHTHQSKAGILGRVAARLSRAGAVVHTVHIIPFTNVSRLQGLIYVLSERMAAHFCDAMVFVSEGAKAEYVRRSIGKGKPALVIPSGMDIARFKNHTGVLTSNDARAVAANHAGKLKLLYLSSFEERKRHGPLLAALARHRRELAGCHIILAGEGSTKGDVAAQVKELGLADLVSILDHCETPEDLIAVSDLCLYASQREGLPRAVIQYLAGGKPVVVSDLPGIDEIVADGVNGIIVPGSDLDALAQAVVRLCGDRHSLQRLADGARQTDISKWRAEVMTRQVDDLYRQLLTARG